MSSSVSDMKLCGVVCYRRQYTVHFSYVQSFSAGGLIGMKLLVAYSVIEFVRNGGYAENAQLTGPCYEHKGSVE